MDCSTITSCLTCTYTTYLQCNSCGGGLNLTGNACTSSSCSSFPNCATCTSDVCQSCVSGFAISNGVCISKCGDGVVTSS